MVKGLRLFNRSFQGWWVLASYHHPDSITWRWLLSFDPRNKRLCLPKFGPSYSFGTKYRSPNGDEFGMWVELPLVGTFGFSTQKHMWKNK